MLSNEEIARVCHEANRGLTQVLRDVPVQAGWDEAPEEQRLSCLDGVRFVLEHPEAPVSASHENWLKMKEGQGWKWGPVKDPEKKEHPAMVPFHQLPLGVRKKDALFKAVVLALR